MKDRIDLGFDEYSENLKRVIKQGRPTGVNGFYPDTLFATFVNSLDALNKVTGGRAALNLVRMCAFLSPDGIDLELLTHPLAREVLRTDFAEAMANPSVRQDALDALVSLSLLQLKDGPIGPVLTFHRLVLAVAHDWMSEADRQYWGTSAVQLVSRMFPDNVSNNPLIWPGCARLMPHIKTLDAYVPRSDLTREILNELFKKASSYLKARGDDEDASALAARITHPVKGPKKRPKVFLVHGRDQGAMNEVARYLEKIEINVIVLHEQAHFGRTIFEKFTEEAGDTNYAVVLMTPDDTGRLRTDKKSRYRARQNVIFELGYFIGKLGAQHVCGLIGESVEKPSDYYGVGYIEFSQKNNWRWELARELRAAGIPFNNQNLI